MSKNGNPESVTMSEPGSENESETPPFKIDAVTLLGDSNIRNYVNKTTSRAHPNLKSAQILSCGSLTIFVETLRQVKTVSNLCIVSCLTDFLASADGPSIVSHRVEPVLQDIRSVLLEIAFDNPNRHYTISPPMYRTSPVWYREGLPEVLTMFSAILSLDRPPNLHLLPSFPTPDYESDGIHLTAFSGLEFILHLFDASQELLSSIDSYDQIPVKIIEANRVLEDRMVAIEQDHRRLNRVFESRTAADAELADFRANERFEHSFVITGLAPISSELIGKAWQTKAVKDVQGVLVILMGREYKIVFVKNSTSRAKDSEVSYNVQLADAAESSQIRKKFGTFFHGRKDNRPEALRHINIKNLVTRETNIRVSVLKLLAQKYRDSNQGSQVQVIHYDARPMIKITPAPTATDRRIMTFNYVQAVQKLPCHLTPAEVAPIIRRIDPQLVGQVRVRLVL